MIIDREQEDSIAFLLEEVEFLAPVFIASTASISRIEKCVPRDKLALSRREAQKATRVRYSQILAEQKIDDIRELYTVTDPEIIKTVREWVMADVLALESVGVLANESLDAHNTGDYRQIAQHSFEILFAAQIYQQLCLAEALATNRDAVLRYIFEDPGLDAIPDSLLQVVYVDAQMNGSSILQGALRQQNGTPLSTEHYLRIGDFSPHASAALGGMVAGLCIGGGVQCPLNPMKLCERFVGDSSESDYPAQVVSDIERVRAEMTKRRLASLDAIRTNGKIVVSKWFQFYGDVRSADAKSPPQKNGRRISGNPNKRASQQDSAINEPRVALQTIPNYATEAKDIPFRVQGQGDEVVDPSDETGVTIMINSIMQSKDIRDYLDKHREVRGGLVELVRGMVQQICLPRLHKGVGGALPLATVDPREFDGLIHRAWRCSGKNMPHNAGKVGNDTRLYYWVATDSEGIRSVRIAAICTKADSVKPMQQNKVPN